VVGAALPLAAATSPSGPGREPVLKQIKVPHRYYYREMYLPQVTSGPSSASWSPDGREVVVAMQGSLWRIALATGIATELTSGPGYDHQPDWSPDGRFIAYACYRDDAVELWLLEVSTGKTWPLTANGAVNLEPRWSPDGSRLAFVSTQVEGRFHVFTMSVDGGRPGTLTRLTEDNDSRLPRYYYSRFDHFLSPTWSPDGRELILVSNRGQVWGTGGFWRVKAEPGAPLREIHFEETSWKARPDWARDGRRVVYSSYLGRQRNQLWLMTAEGGDVFPLTYGEDDATNPRWSPDGTRIAYIRNATGNTSLWTITVPGGHREPVVIRERRRLAATGTLTIRTNLPCRISVTAHDGRGFAPDDALRAADDNFDRAERKFEYSYFFSQGEATLSVPAGSLTLEVVRGLEYRLVRKTVDVAPGGKVSVEVAQERIADLPARGWWSGDLHVHMNYGGHYLLEAKDLVRQMKAEDLHVVENLIVNKEQRIPDLALFTGAPDPASTADTLIYHSQEYHTSFWGHTGLLGLTENILLPGYVGYLNTAAASLHPMNATVADLARAQGALLGYVHPFDARPDLATAAPPAPNAVPGFLPGDPVELPIDVALGKVDYYEAVSLSDHLSTSEVWYRLLNAGFKIPAAAGTDAMANYASLRGPVGMNRVFAKLDGPLEHAGFLAAIKAGRTMATNGPLVELAVRASGGAWTEPGGEIVVPAGKHRLEARVSLRSIVPVDRLELVSSGRVIATLPLTGDRTTADAVVPVSLDRSSWLLLRAYAQHSRHPVLDLYPFGTTSPVYLAVGGAPARSPEDARYFLGWIDRVSASAAAHPGYNTPAEKAAVLKTIADARAVWARLAAEAP
jgi:dipeptidyl aminopeptidase/acylaminoacyl peptidase